MLNNHRAALLTALAAIGLSGCPSPDDRLALLAEPIENRPFVTGWIAKSPNQSAKEAHRGLETTYNRAVRAAAEEMEWTLEKRIATNASNLSTTSETERFRSTAFYGIKAPDLGCEVSTDETGRMQSNCLLTVNVGGFTQTPTPDGINIARDDAWGFAPAMRHTITLRGDALPHAEFTRKASGHLPESIFVFLPYDGGTWFNAGKVINSDN